MASFDSESEAVSSPNEVPARAPQACRHCSRLKRKCQRELPACSLCTRLNRLCEYPEGRRPYGSGRSPDSDQSLAVASNVDEGSAAAPFPCAFFLDHELFTAVSHTALDGTYPVPLQVSYLLGTDPSIICDGYFRSIDTWFPFISRKRLDRSVQGASSADASGNALLLLCMQLTMQVPQPGQFSPANSALYKAAKTYLNNVEAESPTSLRVLQSHILIALYEIGHGIFPAAYLTIGRAARLAILRGAHNRKNATQLFESPPTYTYWEEERRAWWAALILERYINIGPKGFPLATPEPLHGELLPTSDTEWLRGGISTNPALYINSFTPESDIGPFARACQAAHILGRLIHHRDTPKDGTNREFRLAEALQLNTTVMALDAHLSRRMDHSGGDAISTVDIAICSSARFVLYHMYACNEPDVLDERREEESVLQAICIEGVKQSINTRLPSLAWHVLRQFTENPERANPLVIQCLYDGASECQWLIQEGDNAIEGASDCLKILREVLTSLAQRWAIARQYLELLKKSEQG